MISTSTNFGGAKRMPFGALTALLCLFLTSSGLAAGPLLQHAPRTVAIDWSGPLPGLAELTFNHHQLSTARRLAQTSATSAFMPNQCFDRFSAGADTTYCAGEIALLDGGYDSYLGTGSQLSIWRIVEGNGQLQKNNETPNSSVFNNGGSFATVSNGLNTDSVRYLPALNDTLVVLELVVSTDDVTNCFAETSDTVQLFYYPEQTPIIAGFGGTTQQFGPGTGSTVDSLAICSGDALSLEITNETGILTGDPNGLIPLYIYTISGADSLSGLPTADTVTAATFETAFQNLTVTSTDPAAVTATVSVQVVYDRDTGPGINFDCEGPIVDVQLTILPEGQASATFEGATNDVYCESDTAMVRITGTPLSRVAYEITLGNGNTPTLDTLLLGAAGTNGSTPTQAADFIDIPLTGLAGDTISVLLTEIRYQGSSPCPTPLSFLIDARVVPTPTGEISITTPADSLICNGASPSGIGFTFTSPIDTVYDISVEESYGSPLVRDTSMYTVTVSGGSGSFTLVPTFPTDPNGQIVSYSVISLARSAGAGGGLITCANTMRGDTINLYEESTPTASFDVGRPMQTAQTATAGNNVTVSVCDGDSILFANFLRSLPLSDSMAYELDLTVAGDTYGFFGPSRVIDSNFVATVDSLSTLLDLPNSELNPQSITLTFQPRYVNTATGSSQVCTGAPFTVTVNIQPQFTGQLTSMPAATPGATPQINPSVRVCSGESITFVVTSGAAGTATLLDFNGTSQTTSVTTPDGLGGFTGTFTVNNVTAAASFSLIDVVTPAGCRSEFNRTIDVTVEELAQGTVNVTADTVCNNVATSFSVNVTGSNDTVFTTYVTILDPNGNVLATPVLTGPSDSIQPFAATTVPGAYVIRLDSIFNATSSNQCGTRYPAATAPRDTVVVEEVPGFYLNIDDAQISGPSANLLDYNGFNGTGAQSFSACDGTFINFAINNNFGSSISTATGDSLFYYLDIVQDNSQTFSTGQMLTGFIDGVFTPGSFVFSNLELQNNASVAADIDFTITAFYAETRPTPAQFLAGGFCSVPAVPFTITVEPTPEGDFGSNQTICFGDIAVIDLTGSTNADITVEIVSGNANVGTLTAPGQDTVITLTGNQAFLTTGPLTDTLNLRITQVQSPFGCVNLQTLEVEVVVLPLTDAFFTSAPDTTTVCQGTTTNLAVLGTPGATVYYSYGPDVNSTTTVDSFLINATDSIGALMFPNLLDTTTFTIDSIARYELDQTGAIVRCVNAPDSVTSRRVNVEIAPNGDISAVEPVCAGTEQPQLVFTPTAPASAPLPGATYTLVINDSTYTGVQPGVPFNTIVDSVDVTTTFTLTSITESTGGTLMCSSLTGLMDTALVQVEATPMVILDVVLDSVSNIVTASNDTFEMTICSGATFDLHLVGGPATSLAGDSLFYNIDITDPTNVLSANGSTNFNLSATDTTSFLTGLNTVLNNGAPNDTTIIVSFIPYYETTPLSTPSGPGVANACAMDTVTFAITVKDSLRGMFAPGLSDPATCEDSTTTLVFTGTPNTRITFFEPLTNITFNVITDSLGDATFETAPLTQTTGFVVTGLGTVNEMPDCNFLTDLTDIHIVTVVPTPDVTATMSADTICADGTVDLLLTGGPAGGTVNYRFDGAAQTATLNGSGTQTITLTPNSPSTLTLDTMTIIIDSTFSSPSPLLCDAATPDTLVVIVRPLPSGTLSATQPVCFGDSVGLIFNSTVRTENNYTLTVVDPFSNSTTYNNVMDGDTFALVPVSGVYTLTTVVDGTLTGVTCTNTVNDTTTVIVEPEPDLKVRIAQGSNIEFDNGTFVDTYTTILCSGDPISTLFRSTTEVSGGSGDLGVIVSYTDPTGALDGVYANNPDTLNANTADQLDYTVVFDNTTSTNQLVNVVYTPFFEGRPECVGDPLTFNITVTPELSANIQVVDDSICVGDVAEFKITGNPNSFVRLQPQFVANLRPLTAFNEIQLDATGMATVFADVTAAGTGSVFINRIRAVTTVGSQTRQCLTPFADTTSVTVSPLPMGGIIASDNGPICAGGSVDLQFVTSFGPGTYSVVVDGMAYTATIGAAAGTPDTATIFMASPTADSTFSLTSITYGPTGCVRTGTPLSTTTVTVNTVPAGTFLAVDMGLDTTRAAMLRDTAAVCANDSLTFGGMATTSAVGSQAVWAAVSYSGAFDYFGLGSSTDTVYLDPANIQSTFSARLQNLSSNVRYIDLDIQYYIETTPGPGATLDMGECVGDVLRLTVAILPNPVGTNVSQTICSDEAVNFDLDQAIINLDPLADYDATYRYTVVSSDPSLSVPNRLVGNGNNVTVAAGALTNLTGSPQTLTYTVTPSFDDCEGNDFTFTLTVNPEGVIASGLNTMVCSGEDIGISLNLSNDPDAGAGTFNLLSVMPSTTDSRFTAATTNASTGTGLSAAAIALDTFTNLTSVNQTVTYQVAPVTTNGCIGDTLDIVATIFPEPVVTTVFDTVCSSVRLNVDIINDLVVNMVGSPSIVSFQRRRLAGVTNFFVIDENNNQVTFSGGTQVGTSTNAVIQDSLINGTTSAFALFYDITVDDANGCGPRTFTYELLVAPPAIATLDPDNQTTFCSGETIRLIAGVNSNSAPSNLSYTYSVLFADPGVNLVLTPSASSVFVGGAPGTASGNATIQVIIDDASTGCTATATRSITVGADPAPQIIQGPTEPCTGILGTPAIYTVDRVGSNTYAFSIDDPSIGFIVPTGTDTAFQVVVDGSPPQSSYTLTLVETTPDGCETTNTLVISPAVQGTNAEFSFQVNPSNPLEYTFTNLSSGTSNSYLWDFGDGSPTTTAVNPTHIFPDNPMTPGAPFDYQVTLTAVGSCAPFSDSETETVTVNSTDVCETVSLGIGLNFIGFTVEPNDSLIENIFNVPGVLQVNGFNGGTPQIFIPGAGAANTAGFVVSKGAGYIVFTDRIIDITVCGQPIDPNFKRPLNAGVNFVGYMDTIPESADSYLAGLVNPTNTGPLIVAQTFGNGVIGGGQNYVQGGGAANSLTQFDPGRGYRIIVNQPVGSYLGNPGNTEDYEFFFGEVSGLENPAEANIEVINEDGEVIQVITPDENGRFRATPVFGEVFRADGSYVRGLESGERVSFRYNGQVIEMTEGFSGNFGLREVNLEFSATSVADETLFDLEVRIAPNPVSDRAVITLENDAVRPVKLLLMDVNGRVVKQLYANDQLAVGTTRLEWTEAVDLAPGMYTVITLSEGRLLSGLTQRLIKQ